MGNTKSIPLVRIVLVFVLGWLLQLNPLALPYQNAIQNAHQAETQNNSEQTRAAIQQILAFCPWQRDAWLQLANLEQANGNWQAAIDAFLKADALHALNASQKQNLAELYSLRGNFESATAILIVLLQDPLPDSGVFANLAALQLQSNNPGQAKETLLLWANTYPADAQALYQLGILTSLDDPQQALAYLTRAAEITPAYQSALDTLKPVLAFPDNEHPAYQQVVLGRMLGRLQEWNVAEKAFRNAIALLPEYAEALAFLSEALYQTGRDGSMEMQQAIGFNPDSVLCNALWAVQQRRLGNPDIALVALYRAVNLKPEQGIWQFEIGSSLVELDLVSEAYPHFLTAAQLEPDNPLFWMALANYSAATGIHLRDSGLPAARKAIILAPQNPDALDTMGRTLIALGDLENASRYLQAALELEPAHASAHLHLAQVFLNLGESQLALQHLTLAQSYAFQDTDTRQTATRLLERYFSAP